MLYLWMPEANGVWQWTKGEVWQQASSLEQLIQDIQMHHGEEAVVFFPSRNMQITQQTLDKLAYKKLGQEGVRYLLEEYLIVPIDAMKVQHAYQNEQLTIAGVSHSSLETLQHALQLIPVKLVALLPDFMSLPKPQPNEVVLASVGGRLVVRESEFSGYLIDDLAVYLDFHPEDKIYHTNHLSEMQRQTLLAKLAPENLKAFDYTFQPLKKPKQHPFNFAAPSREKSNVSGYWRACAAVLLGIIVVQLSSDGIQWYQNKKAADLVAQQAIAQYQDWFGVNSRVSEQNLKSQFESHVRMNQSGDQQALQLLSRVGPTLMQQQIVAQKVMYEASTLHLELFANTVEQLQTLTQQLSQQGFQVELGNIKPSERGAIGLVKIK